MQQYRVSKAAIVRAFLAVTVRRPVRAATIGWWWLTRRKVRARNHLSAVVATLPDHYKIWLALYQGHSGGAFTAGLPPRGSTPDAGLSVHVHVRALEGEAAKKAIASVLRELTAKDRLYVSTEAAPDYKVGYLADSRIVWLPGPAASRGAGLRQLLAITEAAYFMPLDVEAALTPGAIDVFARAIAVDGSGAAIFYADQDERGPRGLRRNPWLKPQWDEDLFLAQDFVSSACAISTDAARRAGGWDAAEDALVVQALVARLVLAEPAPSVRHIPFVAVTTEIDVWRSDHRGRADMLRAVLAERGAAIGANSGITPGPFGTLIVHPQAPDAWPSVSVVVPTRDRLDLLRTCVEGVLDRTDYPSLELVIADNESIEPATLAYFETCACDPRVKVVQWPHAYNYSAINNFAVARSTGAYLCLLNNDTEVIDSAWLREMVAQAVRPGIGAVGAKLLYPDRSVQHAGVVVGMGGAAGHAHRGLADSEPGYFAQALITRGVTAVTAACLVVARAAFDMVGGFDEDSLAIAYNDVDLCLKLRAAGLRNIYAAQAVLFHHEGKSRGLDFAPEHLARYMRELRAFQQRWASVGFPDPMHHPALDPASEVYRLKV